MFDSAPMGRPTFTCAHGLESLIFAAFQLRFELEDLSIGTRCSWGTVSCGPAGAGQKNSGRRDQCPIQTWRRKHQFLSTFVCDGS